MMSGVSDEMLMAFVDGELDDQSAEAVLRAIETDPDVAHRAAVFETSRDAVRSVFVAVLSEPAPRRLIDLVERGASADSQGSRPSPPAGDNVVPLLRREKAPALAFASGSPYALPLAACLALAVGLGSGLWIGQNGGGGSGGSLFGSGSSLTAALASQPSGPETAIEVDGLASRLSILGSYSVEGGLCRTFRMENEAEAVRGVACDRGNGFAVDVAISDGGESGFSPASDGAAESLDAYLDTLEAEGPLGDVEEAARLKSGGPS